ncbi:MAG TPA: polyphenol oxidase family protein [Acidimicrobiales bacterium]|nr:polyphenol oxidase family protein [Acidimicrobiales bacterium]
MAAWWSGRSAGDQRTVDTGTLPPPVPAGLSVHRLSQVHGSAVVVVDGRAPAGTAGWVASPDGRPPEADAVVAVGSGSCLAVLTADCAPVALGSPEGVHGAVHVGWRGLVAGVIARAVETMRALGATDVVAGLGPTIHPCCYAFGGDDLDTVAAAVGGGVRSVTSGGDPALDLPAGVRARLAAAGAGLVVDVDRCTACGGDAFSHRARAEDARQALFVWRVTGGPVP